MVQNKYVNMLLFFMLLFTGLGYSEDVTNEKEIKVYKKWLFKPYAEDSLRCNEVFSVLKRDFYPGGINLKDSSGVDRVNEYIELRDAWLKSKSIANLRMAILITKGILMLMLEYNNIDDLLTVNGDGMVWDMLFNRVRITKNNVFMVYDEACLHNKKWKSYRMLCGSDNNTNELTKGWETYVKQYNLFYKKYGAELNGSCRVLTDDMKTDQSAKLSYYVNFIKEPKCATDVQMIAALIDVMEFVKYLRPVLRKKGKDFNIVEFSFNLLSKYKSPETAGLFLNGMEGKVVAIAGLGGMINRNQLKRYWENRFGYIDELW